MAYKVYLCDILGAIRGAVEGAIAGARCEVAGSDGLIVGGDQAAEHEASDRRNGARR